jgi:hypothetical protein
MEDMRGLLQLLNLGSAIMRGVAGQLCERVGQLPASAWKRSRELLDGVDEQARPCAIRVTHCRFAPRCKVPAMLRLFIFDTRFRAGRNGVKRVSLAGSGVGLPQAGP